MDSEPSAIFSIRIALLEARGFTAEDFALSHPGGKLSLGYKFSGAHSLEANAVYLQQAPKFATAFVSPRTRNTTTPGLKAEKVFGVDLTYNLNLPYIKARLSGGR